MKTYNTKIFVEGKIPNLGTGGYYTITAKDENDLLKKAAKKMAIKVSEMIRRNVTLFDKNETKFKMIVEVNENVVGPFNKTLKATFNLV